jgi:hypothetical protein
MRRAVDLFAELGRAGRGRDLADVASRFRRLSQELKNGRPDVTDAIIRGLGAFCSHTRAMELVDLYERDDEGRESAALLVDAFGEALAPAFLGLLDEPAYANARPLAALMCGHAAALAPGIAQRFGQCGVAAARVGVRVCGFAGAGYEPAIAEHLSSADEQTVREALRALARIGTARAASLVGVQIHSGPPATRAAAEEALWHFPRAQTLIQLRDLLGRREFVVSNPQVAARLLERASQGDAAGGLDGVLAELEGLRFHFWSPGLVRVALKARELRVR